jgi:hypothetical protein
MKCVKINTGQVNIIKKAKEIKKTLTYLFSAGFNITKNQCTPGTTTGIYMVPSMLNLYFRFPSRVT